jgi:hypothetical protein
MLRLIPFLAVGLLAGCSGVEVLNTTESSVTVQVTVPDRSGSVTRSISAGEMSLFFSEHGGSYTVGTIPDQRFLETLQSLRSEISGRLFLQGGNLSAGEVEQLQIRLIDIDRILKETQSNSRSGSCGGRIPDLEVARVVISYDEAEGRYRVGCG